MQSRWHIVALALVLAGCFDTHGLGSDGGLTPPPVDAGGAECRSYPASVMELRCEPPELAGGEGRVTVLTSPTACCGSGAVASSIAAAGPGRHRVELAWTACDCCAGCRCIGPMETVTLRTGPLEPGTHVVEAYGVTCTMEVAAPSACGPTFGTELRAPRHLFVGQSFPATLTASAGGCGCTPRVVASAEDGYDLRMEICDCCGMCDCIDTGYQSSVVLDPPALGRHPLSFPGGSDTLVVHAPEECRPVTATGIEIVPPMEDWIVTGPRLHWARVSGEQALCCAEPAPVVERFDTTGAGIALELSSCAMDPCPCIPAEATAFETWFSLGELAPGEHTVRVGAHEARVLVP